MRWHQKVFLRIRSLFRKNSVDSELDSELQFHIEMQTRENIAQGMRADDVHYLARRLFGPMDRMKEESAMSAVRVSSRPLRRISATARVC